MASHVGYLAAPTWRLRYAFLVAGLVVGLAAVGTWLHSCSAYTGRTLHRNRTVRLAGDGRDPVVVDGDDHVHDSNRAAREPFPELAGVTGEPLAAVVPEVAEAHGWRVRAVEDTDGGARFEVTGVEFTG